MLDDEESKYELWTATEIGKLIAGSPHMQSDPPKEVIFDFLTACFNRLGDRNRKSFERFIGIQIFSNPSENTRPQISTLAKLCYHLGIPLSDVLLNNRQPTELLEKSFKTRLVSGPYHGAAELQRVLLLALEEDPPPSIREISSRLRYKYPSSLSVRCPDLCRKLRARHEAARPKAKRAISGKIRDRATYIHALEEALKREEPPTLTQIARELGDDQPHNFHKKFPKLCKALSRRRAKLRNQQRHQLRTILEPVLLENPPPTLKVVAEHLGYQRSELRRHCGELVRAISARAKKYRRVRLQEIGYVLEALLTHEPPLTLQEAAARVGHSPGYMRAKLPKVCAKISKRYAEYRSRRSLGRKEAAKNKIGTLALELVGRGIYPSAERIKHDLGGPYVISPNELCALLRQIRQELDLDPR